MTYQKIFYPETEFGGFTDVDGTVAFYTRVNSLLNSSFVVLNIGCGRGQHAEDPVPLRRNLQIFKGKCKEVIGIDVDKNGEINPFLDKFYLIEKGSWPLENNSVDLAICDCVLEHIEEPQYFFSECKRVIKPEGYLCIRTTNIMSYVGLFATLIPNSLHSKVLNKVQTDRKEKDVFPTVYRCNTQAKIRYMLNKYSFEHCVYGYEAEPSYFSFSYLFYLLGVIHQRLAPNAIKVTIFAFGKKQKD